MKKYSLLKNQEGKRAVRINASGQIIKEDENPALYQELRKRALNNGKARARNQALKDLGLVRVRGAQGGIYWE